MNQAVVRPLLVGCDGNGDSLNGDRAGREAIDSRIRRRSANLANMAKPRRSRSLRRRWSGVPWRPAVACSSPSGAMEGDSFSSRPTSPVHRQRALFSLSFSLFFSFSLPPHDAAMHRCTQADLSSSSSSAVASSSSSCCSSPSSSSSPSIPILVLPSCTRPYRGIRADTVADRRYSKKLNLLLRRARGSSSFFFALPPRSILPYLRSHPPSLALCRPPKSASKQASSSLHHLLREDALRRVVFHERLN